MQEKELQRLSALLVEHQALLKSLPEMPHQEPIQDPPENLSQLRCEIMDYLPGMVNTNRWATLKAGQVHDLSGPPTVRRKTFEDIHTDMEVPATPQRQVQFANIVTSTFIVLGRPTEHLVELTPQMGTFQVPLYKEGPFIHPESPKDLFEEGFSCSPQAAATEFKKLWEPKLAKRNGGYSSDASLVFQSWLKDIWLYVLECHLP